MSSDFETLNKILDGRYSCRAFQDKAVPIQDMHAIIQAAQKVPSWCNFQPWQMHLVANLLIYSFFNSKLNLEFLKNNYL